MNNTRTLELINALVNVKEKRNYEEEMLWNELYEACTKELKKKIFYKSYDFFRVDWSQEDFVQEVMLIVYKNLDKYDATCAQFATWLGTIGAKIYYKHYNMCAKKRDKGIDVIPMCVEDEDHKSFNMIDKVKCANSVEDEYIHQLKLTTMYDAIDNLKSNYRQVVTLCDVEGRKPREVSKILGCNSKDVSDWLYRGHRALAKSLVNESLESEYY